jgi:hypothetical protein
LSTVRSAQSITDVLRTLLSDRRTLVAAWLVIGVECIAALYLFRPWAIGDSFHYLLLAKNLADGHYGSVTAAGFEPDVLRPPGYPIILWFLLEVLGLPRGAAVAAQVVGICGAIYAIQRFLVSRGVNPTAFIVIAAVYPFPLLYGANLLAESWAIVATTMAGLLVVRGNARAYIWSGAAAGIAALMRSDMLLLPLVLSAVIVIDQLRQHGWRAAGLGKAFLPIVAAGLVLLPYTVWNYAHFHRAAPLPAAGAVGTSLYLSTWQRELSWDDVQTIIRGGSTPHIEQIGLGPAIRQINHSIGAPERILAFDPWAYPTNHLRIAAADEFRRAAISRIAADPGRYVEHVLHNIWALWVTKRYDRLPTIAAIALAASSAAIFILGLAGMVMAVVRWRASWIPWLLVPVTLYPAAIHLWLHTEARYTAATRPLLMMFAGAFIAWLLSRERTEGAHNMAAGS